MEPSSAEVVPIVTATIGILVGLGGFGFGIYKYMDTKETAFSERSQKFLEEKIDRNYQRISETWRLVRDINGRVRRHDLEIVRLQERFGVRSIDEPRSGHEGDE